MTDTSQRPGPKFEACLVALGGPIKLGLMLSVDSLALAAWMMLATLVSGQIVAALALTVMMVIGGFAALAVARLYCSVTRYFVRRSLAFASPGLLLLNVALSLSASCDGWLAPWSFDLCFGAASMTCLWLSRLCVRILLQQLSTLHAQLARAMASTGEFRPVCFFDEKRAFTHRSVAGLEVFPVTALQKQAARQSIGSIVIALPNSSLLPMRALTHKLVQAGVRVRWFRNQLDMHEEGEVRGTLSEICLEHLLRHIPFMQDVCLSSLCVQGKNVLVISVGGSIGAELCRQLCALQPRPLALIDHSKFFLYIISAELRLRWPKLTVHLHLGSVRNAAWCASGMSLVFSGRWFPCSRSRLRAAGRSVSRIPSHSLFHASRRSSPTCSAGRCDNAQGAVFVVHTGEPVRILNMARTVIGLSDLTENNARNPDSDIEIEFIGLYPGEKLCEELLIGDGVKPNDHPAIPRVCRHALVCPEQTGRTERLLQACQSSERCYINAMLVALVPESRTTPKWPSRPVTTAVHHDVSYDIKTHAPSAPSNPVFKKVSSCATTIAHSH